MHFTNEWQPGDPISIDGGSMYKAIRLEDGGAMGSHTLVPKPSDCTCDNSELNFDCPVHHGPAKPRWEFYGPDQWDYTCANNHRPIQMRQVDGLECPLCKGKP